MSFQIPLLLDASPSAPAFVVAVGSAAAALASALTGIGLTPLPANSVAIGANSVPISGLTHVVGLLFDAAAPLAQGVAFLSAVIASDTVVLDVADVALLWAFAATGSTRRSRSSSRTLRCSALARGSIRRTISWRPPAASTL
jgi:hypothetical protein